MLTEAQIAALRADIATRPQVLEWTSTGQDQQVVDFYNALVDFWVWKTRLTRKEAVETTTPEGTTFSWTAYIGRSQGERDAFREIFVSEVNPSLANIRSAFADIFSGAPGQAQRDHLLAVARRKARLIEKVLATGTGSTASPATMGFEGTLTTADVGSAR